MPQSRSRPSRQATAYKMVLRMQGIDPAKYPDLMKAWDELDYNKQMTEGTQLNIYDDDVDIRNGRKTQ